MKSLFFIVSIYLLAVVSPLRTQLEASMLSHVLIQIPILILCGYYLGKKLAGNAVIERVSLQLNDKGIPSLILVSLMLAFWMLPRVLDNALLDSNWTLAKYLSIPLLIGLPLALSWSQAGVITRALIKVELITMLLRLGWLYLVSPIRLCSVYQLNEQILLGKSMLILAIILSVVWIIQLFVQQPQKQDHQASLGV